MRGASEKGQVAGNGEFRVVRASEVPPAEAGRKAWLIEGLWAAGGVGVIGGSPKVCKSWLALEMAVRIETTP